MLEFKIESNTFQKQVVKLGWITASGWRTYDMNPKITLRVFILSAN
jgi:hypothetical protein